jgi:hypothetical protein
MDDRHYLTEPRPIPGLSLPTWEVDIFRDGVDTPVLTLRVDSESLPPRHGKKKKIVWKLPDDVNQIPKFGLEDKKRIFELYKHEKKMRRLMRKNPSTAGTGNIEEEDDADADAVKNDLADSDPPEKNGKGEKSEARKEDKAGAVSTQEIQQPPPPAAPGPGPPAKKAPPAASAPPGFQSLYISGKEEKSDWEGGSRMKDAVSNGGNALSNGSKTTPPPPPSKPIATPPKPHRAFSEPPGLSAPPGIQQQELHQPQQPSVRPPPPGISSPPPPGITSPLLRKNILVPRGTAIASVVAELYYGLITRGLISQLLPYYTATAQKSLTVGGAHAVCGPTLAEKGLQLKHLVGMVVTIKGVLQQPTTGPGVLVLITGICVQPHALPFCHSLILVPVDNGFQIQNDALCFLTTEMATAAPEADSGATAN